jgi:hypothetical protein
VPCTASILLPGINHPAVTISGLCPNASEPIQLNFSVSGIPEVGVRRDQAGIWLRVDDSASTPYFLECSVEPVGALTGSSLRFAVGEAGGVHLSFTNEMDLTAGDVFTLTLPGFAAESSEFPVEVTLTYTLHHTLHPTPHTLHPTPYTLHPTPCTLHPTLHALRAQL